MKNWKINRIKENPVYIRAAAIAAGTAVCFACLYLYDNSRKIRVDEEGRQILERNEDGTDSAYEMEIRVGEIREEIEVPVSGEKYTEEEASEILESAGEKLEKLILGENQSLEEVRKSLDLVAEIPNTGITVSWQLDRYDVMDTGGNLIADEISEDGDLVRLTADLSLGSARAVHEFYAKVFPPVLSPGETLTAQIEDRIKEADKATETERYLVLPDRINGEEIRWEYTRNTRAFAVLVMGAGASCMVLISESQRKKEKEKIASRQLQIDYPQIINKFNLYIRSGMTIRKAWFCIAGDYEKSGKRDRKAYEEMCIAMHRIRGGTPEGEVYEEYGIRCGEAMYRKFGTMLSQNLRKGSGGITELLAREAEEAFEERKNLAKRLGEEAGTKLMIPMFMMLVIVFAMVVIPAFFSIQI